MENKVVVDAVILEEHHRVGTFFAFIDLEEKSVDSGLYTFLQAVVENHPEFEWTIVGSRMATGVRKETS